MLLDDICTLCVVPRKQSSRLPSSSEAKASELLGSLEEIFPLYQVVEDLNTLHMSFVIINRVNKTAIYQ